MRRGFEVARVASQQSNAKHSRKIGAALYAGSTLLTIGFNTYCMSHPEAADMCNIHAEHRAIIRRRYYDNRRKLSLYVYRETRDGALACSKPCLNCQRLLKEAGVNRIYFINLRGETEEMKI